MALLNGKNGMCVCVYIVFIYIEHFTTKVIT